MLEKFKKLHNYWKKPASSGMLINSSIVRVSLPSVSNFLNLRCNRLSSLSEKLDIVFIFSSSSPVKLESTFPMLPGRLDTDLSTSHERCTWKKIWGIADLELYSWRKKIVYPILHFSNFKNYPLLNQRSS